MSQAIDPAAIPGAGLNPDEIEVQAGAISGISTSVADNGYQVHSTWQQMGGVYEAPESQTLLGLMQPVNQSATAVGDNLAVVSSALMAFAAEVRPIKNALDSLRLQAQTFVDTTVANGVYRRELNPAWVNMHSGYGYGYSGYNYGGTSAYDPPKYRTVHKQWHEDQASVDRNNELLEQVNAQQVLLWDAERTCANKIRALYGGGELRAFTSEDDPLGYGLDEIPEGTEMPWGAPVERTEGCAEATVKFVFVDFLWEGVIVGGIWGTVEGLGTLVLGYNPETGEFFSGDAYGAAWGNLAMLGYAALANSPALGLVYGADAIAQAAGGEGFLPQGMRDLKADADQVAIETGKSLIAWDKWADDPGTALGESVFNVATILVPAGAAISGIKGAGAAANVLSKMAKVVDFIDPGAWAFNGATRLGGITLAGFDDLIGQLDLAARAGDDFTLTMGAFDDGFDLAPVQVLQGADTASAVSHLIDDLGIPPRDITVGFLADGTPAVRAPGIEVRLADDAIAGIRPRDPEAAVVREPELVTSGGARGETGGGPVNSIVDEPPARTETGGSGEGAGTGSSGGGTGGSGWDGGGDGGGSGGSGGSGAGGGIGDDAIRAGDPGDRPIVDSSGHDITEIIDSSDLSREQLWDYLQQNHPAQFDEFLETGAWPAEVQIPRGPYVLDDAGRIDWSQVPDDGFAHDPVTGEVLREDYVPPIGEIVDRYGPPGRFTSPIGEDGPFPYDARSLPYVADPAQYHRYEIIGDMGDIPAAVRNHPDLELRQHIEDTLARFNVSLDSLKVQRGPIAPGFEATGGGTQYLFPLTVDILEDLGLIRELP